MAQKTDIQLSTQADEVRDETTANANTALRVGTLFEDIVDSKMNNSLLIDEDDMSSDSATRPPSQQSVKAYVDAEVAGAGITIDATPTNGSTNAVQSDGVFDALALKQTLVNSATALTDAGTIDLTAIKHTLTTSSSRTFTISYTGDDITMEVTLSATSATQTFPATSLCVSEGIASGDNTCPMSGASGDKYVIAIKKIGSNYRVVCKNFGQ